MRRLLVVLLLCACAPTPTDAPTSVSGACQRSFRPTLEAWEAARGRVPDTCAYLDAEYAVQLVEQGELPCDAAGDNELLVGCTQGDTIYLLRGRDNVQLVDTSVHEWVHALADCVYGDVDRDHLRAGLWALDGAETVELQAQASAEIGRCL